MVFWIGRLILSFRPGKGVITLGFIAGLAVQVLTLEAFSGERGSYNIEAASLEKVLLGVARQNSIQIIFATDLTQGIISPGVTGRYTVEEALGKVLAGTDLVASRINERLFVVQGARPDDLPDPPEPSDRDETGPDMSPALSEEIIVTAHRRVQNVQDIASSVSVLTGADLGRMGIDSAEDYGRLIPGIVLFQPIRNRGFFNARGIATSIMGGNTQDPVSVYLNDTPITDTFGAVVQPDLRLFDIERIEVLRGPQGTLFGSGSLGGTVRIITKEPDMRKPAATVRADMAVSKGGALRQRYDGMINLPIEADRLAVRFVGYYRDEEGWVENVALNTKNSTTDWGGRIAVLWQVTPEFSVKVQTLHQDSKPEDGDSWNPDLGKYRKSSVIPVGRPSTLTNHNLTLEKTVPGFAHVTSATTYQYSKTAVFADRGDALGIGLPLLEMHDNWISRFITQEVRLVSSGVTALDWVAGGFFIDRSTRTDFLVTVPGFPEKLGAVLADDAVFRSKISTASREVAAYGDVNYALSSRWTLSGGMRVFRTMTAYTEPDRYLVDLATLTASRSSFRNKAADNNHTWRAAIAYEPADDVLVYASVGKGFRIGQVNPNLPAELTVPSSVTVPASYQPDTTWNHEIGMKSIWLDGRLMINVAGYYIDWKNIQIDLRHPSDGLSFVANTGRAVSKGVELEMSAQPMPDLDVDLALTFQDARIHRISALESLMSGAVKGARLPGSVKFKLSGGVQYSRTVRGGTEFFVRVDGEYLGASPNRFSRLPGTDGENPFFRHNAAHENLRVAVGVVADTWDFTVYGENMTNNDDFILTDGGADPNSVNTLRPRTIGARLKLMY